MDPRPTYAVRQLRPPPPPVVLPALLTDIFLESFPAPVALTPLKPTRARIRIPTRARTPPATHTPARARTPARAHTPARARTPARVCTPARARSPACATTPARTSPEAFSSPLTTPETTPEPSCAGQDPKTIKRPSNANISHVKSIFARIYSDLEAEKQDAQYLRFRNHLDKLTAIHLDSSLSLSHQDGDSVEIVIKDLVKEFPWLARCTKTWPVTVCLQGKLHNSAARNSDKDTRKLLTTIRDLKSARKP